MIIDTIFFIPELIPLFFNYVLLLPIISILTVLAKIVLIKQMLLDLQCILVELFCKKCHLCHFFKCYRIFHCFFGGLAPSKYAVVLNEYGGMSVTASAMTLPVFHSYASSIFSFVSSRAQGTLPKNASACVVPYAGISRPLWANAVA